MAPKERGLSTMASQQAGQLTSIMPTPRMAVLLLHRLAEHVQGKAAGGSQEAQPEPRTARPRAVGPLDFLSRIASICTRSKVKRSVNFQGTNSNTSPGHGGFQLQTSKK